MNKLSMVLVSLPFSVVLVHGPALAVDGVIEIDPTRALSGSVSPGDAPGFPITLSEPGSYRLTANLGVTDPNLDLFEVTSNHVSIDLNGFEISGPTACTGNPTVSVTCVPSGSGTAVRLVSGAGNLQLYDGTVRGMAGKGVDGFSSNDVHIENVRFTDIAGTVIDLGNRAEIVRNSIFGNGGKSIVVATRGQIQGNTISENASTSIQTNGESSITHNIIEFNGGAGISAASSCQILHNVVVSNEGIGISASSASVLIGNSVSSNDGLGLSLDTNSGYSMNVLRSNSGGQVSGGVQMGQNVCNGSLCP